jgi:hypothetical protein
MKIKTITCHNVYNYGASLQSYALMKYLQNQGYEVEIIDYRPFYLSQRYNLWRINLKWSRNIFQKLIYYILKIPIRLVKDLPRKKAFDRFTKKNLILTSKTYHTNEELKADVPYADLYLAGSDQIWNSLYNNGKDPAFYLDFALKTSIKASYAPSFSVNYIEKDYEVRVKNWLHKLDYISVREATGISILQSIGIQGVQVMDPVFLLPMFEWQNLSTEGLIKGKYILVYDFENNPVIESFAKEISAKTKYPIVSITDYVKQSYAYKNINAASPWDFIGLIKNCDIFITNSFHGTAFSIIFNKEFYTFNRIHQNVNSRMIDLLQSVGLQNRLITLDSKLDMTNTIDYKSVNALMSDKILFSKKYLKQVCTPLSH